MRSPCVGWPHHLRQPSAPRSEPCPGRSGAVKEFEVRPDPDDPRLSVAVAGIDHEGQAGRDRRRHRAAADAVPQRPRDRDDDDHRRSSRPAGGRLSAQPEHAAGRTTRSPPSTTTRTSTPSSCARARQTDYEDKLKKKIQTSGCAQGTVFGDLMEEFDQVALNPDARVKTSWLYQLTKKINTEPSLYLKAGAIHGCVLCQRGQAARSTWRTSAATTPSTRSRATCSSTASRPTTRSSTPPAGSPPRW